MQVGKQRGKHALTSRKYILCLMRTFLDTSLRKRDLISDTAVFQGRSQDWSGGGGVVTKVAIVGLKEVPGAGSVEFFLPNFHVIMSLPGRGWGQPSKNLNTPLVFS